MGMTKNINLDRFHLQTGRKSQTTRLKQCVQTLAEMGLNPFREIARLAIKAERNGDLTVASTNWRFLGEFVDAKRKPIDPLEQKQLEKQLTTLEDLSKLRAAILGGTMVAIEEDSIIEPEAIDTEEVKAISEFI